MSDWIQVYNRLELKSCPDKVAEKRMFKNYTRTLNLDSFNQIIKSLVEIGLDESEIIKLFSYIYEHQRDGKQFWNLESNLQSLGEMKVMLLFQTQSEILLRKGIYHDCLPFEVANAGKEIMNIFDVKEVLDEFSLFIFNNRLYFIYYEMCKALSYGLYSVQDIFTLLANIQN